MVIARLCHGAHALIRLISLIDEIEGADSDTGDGGHRYLPVHLSGGSFLGLSLLLEEDSSVELWSAVTDEFPDSQLRHLIWRSGA